LTTRLDRTTFSAEKIVQNVEFSRPIGAVRSASQETFRKRALAALFFALIAIYNSNLHLVFSGDSAATKTLPLSLLLDCHLYLDRFAPVYLRGPWKDPETGGYSHAIVYRRGHWLSTYPVALPILISPLYIPLALYIHKYNLPLDSKLILRALDLMEKLSASVIAALSAVVMLVLLARIAESRSTAAGLTLIYALASNTWTIGSQALWQHGLSELAIATTLWTVILAEESPKLLYAAGLAAGIATINRPPNLIFAIMIGLYVLARHRRDAWRFAPAPLCLGLAFAWYNFYFFGALTGGYAGQGWTTPLAAGLAGLLLSPSRGLFIYTPWTLFSVWGATIALRGRREFPLIACVAIISAGELLLYAKWWCWWGGWCFGPRILTDILPLLTILLIPAIEKIRTSAFFKMAFAAAVVVSFGVQVIGAYFYINQSIDATNLWSWRDSQLVEAVRLHKLEFWSPRTSALLNATNAK